MTDASGVAADLLPALGLLAHRPRVVPRDVGAAAEPGRASVVLVDARTELAAARTLCRLLATVAPDLPVIAVVTEGGLAAVTSDWDLADVVLDSAGPAEVEARLRLALGRAGAEAAAASIAAGGGVTVTLGDLVVDEEGYSARLRGRPLDLTYREFELLKYLAQNPGRVFTRAQLLQEVWGYDYYGGTRTVDVHVRRLRAKLGSDHESLISTVRNVGYRLLAGP